MAIDVKYTAQATALGDGRNGEVTSSDGVIDEKLASPVELGGRGGATNPEQLFAAGYAACFHGALRLVAGKAKVEIGDATEVTANIGFGSDDSDGGFGLTAQLVAKLPGLDQATADKLVEQAHQVCPYSKATRGNIDVQVSATV